MLQRKKQNKTRGIQAAWNTGIRILTRWDFREDLTEVTFQCRAEGDDGVDGVSYGTVGGKSVSGSKTSPCKGPEAGESLARSRNRQGIRSGQS